MRVEILIDSTDRTPMNPKGEAMLKAFAACAPTGAKITSTYRGDADLLMIYGAGAAQRHVAMARHLRAGKHVVVWDLGYWDKVQGGMRLAIDTLHPTHAQMSETAPESRREFTLREDGSADGPIMLIGMGRKSCPLYGLQPMVWERTKMRELRERFPGRKVLWRPKGRNPLPLLDAPMSHGTDIETAIKGCAMIVCRHSNVAVDACIAGVSVECESGAARWLYKSTGSPTPDQRRDFLARLSHWNYTPNEAEEGWRFIERMLRCAS